MALTQGSIVSWDDLNSIYTNLSSTRTKFSFSACSNPVQRYSIVNNNPISNLKTLVNEMSSNRFLTTVAVSNIQIPTPGQLLMANFLSDLNITINNIKNVCPHDSTNFSGFNGSNFGFNGSNFSGFRGSFNGSNHGFNGSNHGFNGSNHSFNPNSSNVGTFSWRGSSFGSRSSNFSHNAARWWR